MIERRQDEREKAQNEEVKGQKQDPAKLTCHLRRERNSFK